MGAGAVASPPLPLGGGASAAAFLSSLAFALRCLRLLLSFFFLSGDLPPLLVAASPWIGSGSRAGWETPTPSRVPLTTMLIQDANSAPSNGGTSSMTVTTVAIPVLSVTLRVIRIF